MRDDLLTRNPLHVPLDQFVLILRFPQLADLGDAAGEFDFDLHAVIRAGAEGEPGAAVDTQHADHVGWGILAETAVDDSCAFVLALHFPPPRLAITLSSAVRTSLGACLML